MRHTRSRHPWRLYYIWNALYIALYIGDSLSRKNKVTVIPKIRRFDTTYLAVIISFVLLCIAYTADDIRFYVVETSGFKNYLDLFFLLKIFLSRVYRIPNSYFVLQSSKLLEIFFFNNSTKFKLFLPQA